MQKKIYKYVIVQEQEDTVNKEQGSQEDKQALIDMFVELVKIDQGYFWFLPKTETKFVKWWKKLDQTRDWEMSVFWLIWPAGLFGGL